jgi:hypothetical protein
MAISLSPLKPGTRDRADSSGRGHHVVGWAARVLLLVVALLAMATPALAATNAAPGAHTSSPAQAASADPSSSTAPAAQARLTSMVTQDLPSGVCQVPGIGDIGGLVGLCSQGSSGLVGDLNNICEPSLPQPEQAAIPRLHERGVGLVERALPGVHLLVVLPRLGDHHGDAFWPVRRGCAAEFTAVEGIRRGCR